MGRSHMIYGGAFGIATGAFVMHAPIADQVLMLFVGAFGGLLPDLDTHASLLGARLPRWWHRLTPGHRGAAHSIWAIGVIYVLAWGVQQVGDGQLHPWRGPNEWYFPAALAVGTFVLVWLAMWFSSTKLHLRPAQKRPYLLPLVLALIVFALAWAVQWADGAKLHLWHTPDQPYLPIALMVGAFSHLVADSLTTQGVPLFYPWERDFWLLGERRSFATGTKGEGFAVLAVIAVAGALVVYPLVSPHASGLVNSPHVMGLPTSGVLVFLACLVGVCLIMVAYHFYSIGKGNHQPRKSRSDRHPGRAAHAAQTRRSRSSSKRPSTSRRTSRTRR